MDMIQLKLRLMERETPSRKTYGPLKNLIGNARFYLKNKKGRELVSNLHSIFPSLEERLIDCQKAINDENLNPKAREYLIKTLKNSLLKKMNGFEQLGDMELAKKYDKNSQKIVAMIYDIENEVKSLENLDGAESFTKIYANLLN